MANDALRPYNKIKCISHASFDGILIETRDLKKFFIAHLNPSKKIKNKNLRNQGHLGGRVV